MCPLTALILYEPFYDRRGFTITHFLVFNCVPCMIFVCYSFIVLALMSVFDLSPLRSRRMDTYSIGSTDLRDDALDDMMHHIHLNSKESEFMDQESEQEQLHHRADNFIHAMSPEQGRRTVNVNPNPADVFQYSTSTPIDQLRPLLRPMVDEYNYFNLQNIKAPVPPKWKDNDNILEDFKNMLLIWAGPDGEDINENLRLPSSQQYDMYVIFEEFERYCEPTCNF